ncbi:MAG: phage integrase family protein [Fibrobacter sp.]|nr:phage integrase family protein [Fibrobacter sp.]
MIFDKNEKRARELELKDPVKNREKILEYRSKSNWFIRYWVKGIPHDERCPEKYQTASGAEQYYKIVAGKAESGDHLIPVIRKTTIVDMVDFFLIYRKKKVDRAGKNGGYSSAKTICLHIANDIGKLTFDQCRENPQRLQDYIDNLPVIHPGWSPKYCWNIVKELKAIFSTWINKKLLSIPNPMNAIDEPLPDTRVIQYVPTQEDYEKIITTGLKERVRLDVLRLIGAVRYTGFRVGEILQWRCEDCVLKPTDGGLPYIWVEISKQRHKTRVPRPIRSELVPILQEQINGRSEGPVWPWKTPPYKLLDIYEWGDHNGRNGYPERLKFKGTLYQVAGVEVPRPFHDFRKTVKLELKRLLGDSKKARDYQGHKSESMDDWYTWYQREDLEEAVKESYKKG